MKLPKRVLTSLVPFETGRTPRVYCLAEVTLPSLAYIQIPLQYFVDHMLLLASINLSKKAINSTMKISRSPMPIQRSPPMTSLRSISCGHSL